MAVYASPEEMTRPAGRSNKWTVTIILTAFLALIYFLQSEEATDRLVAFQHVVKKASVRGISNKTTSYQDLDIQDDDVQADDKPHDEPENKPAEGESVTKPGLVKVVVSGKANDSKGETASVSVPAQVETESATKEETKNGGEADDKLQDEFENKPNQDESEAKTGLVKVVVSANENDNIDDESNSGGGSEIETNEKQGVPSVEPAQKQEGEAKAIEEDKPKEETEAKTAASDALAEHDAYSPTEVKPESQENECSSICLSRVQQHKERWGGDLLNITDVGRIAKEAYDKLIGQLKVDYGADNFVKIFEVDGESRGRTSFLPANVEDGLSLKRFKRKLKIKILSAQASIQEELDMFGECDCKTDAKGRSRRNLEPTIPDKGVFPLADHYERLVWATGGHSSAAGHGNLFNESYTAFMEHALTDVFGAIGIEFEGRNDAMGGTDSAPEIALCEEAIMGTDIDVISWDFGMTDGRLWDRKGMYANRAGLNPNRPAIVDMFVDKFVERRTEELRKVEERGLTALYMNPDAFKEMKDGIPDTFGLTSEQINAMPRMVRHFKCQDTLEKGDPTCGAMKFDNDVICPDRKAMSSWHPGW